MTNENGEKRLLYQILIVSLSLILGLVTTVWAITWRATDTKTEKNCVKVESHETRITKLESDSEYIKDRLDQIYSEVKQK